VNLIVSQSTDERVAEVVAALITSAMVMAQHLPKGERKAVAQHMIAEATALLKVVQPNDGITSARPSPKVRRWDD
jgi:hypothetical protein